MSERVKKASGCGLLVLCILLCLAPMLSSEPHRAVFRAKGEQRQIVTPVRTERRGSVRVNDADEEELTKLPGVGLSYAARIVAERAANGPFFYPEDLTAVKGIGSRTVERFRDMIDLSLNESGE